MLALLLLLPILAAADGNSCYTCASDELRSRWQLTGLPRVSDQYFMSCSGSSANMKRESCPGPCFVMMFDDPDANQDSGTSGNTLFVRGCHATVMQVTTNRSSANGAPYCEWDTTYPMSDSRGTMKHVYMLMEFCSTSDCNSRKTYTESTCNQQSADLLNNQPIQCYECTPKEGSNCKDSRCTKKYCMKQTVNVGGAWQTTKSCSNVNIIGIDTYCTTNDVISTPGGVAVKNRYRQCYCKDKQYCNGAVGSLPVSVLVSLTISLILL